MKIIITGGCGFLGSHIAEEAIKKKYKVVVIDKVLKNKIQNVNVNYIKANISNERLLKKIIKKDDIVFHLSAISDIDQASLNSVRTVNENILTTVKLLEICRLRKIKKFIFGSSIYVHSSIGGIYRISKKSSELFVEEISKKSGFKFVILRFGSVYGPRQNIKNNISKIMHNAFIKKKLIYSGSRKSIRKFIYVKDIAKLSLKIIDKQYDNKIVLLEGEKKISLVTVLKIIKKKLKLKGKMIFENNKENHYIKNPYSYKEIKEKKIYLKKNIDITQGINELFKYKKK